MTATWTGAVRVTSHGRRTGRWPVYVPADDLTVAAEQEETVIRRETRAMVAAAAVAALPPRDAALVTALYGLGRDEVTVPEMAVEWGISPQRVRQLHMRTLLRLRERLGLARDMGL